jgi:hypothetical protein
VGNASTTSAIITVGRVLRQMNFRSILHIHPVRLPVASLAFKDHAVAREQDYRVIGANVKYLAKVFFKQHALGKPRRPPVHYGYHRVNIDGGRFSAASITHRQ